MTIQVTIDMKVKDGHFEGLREWFIEHLPGTRSFEGNISVEVSRNQDDPRQVLFVEKWENRQTFESYLAWRDATGAIADLVEKLDGDITFRFHDFIGV